MGDTGVVGAFYDSWQLMGALLDDAELRLLPHGVAGVTQVPLPTMNGLWSGDATLPADEASSALDEVAARGVPYCLQCPVGADPSVAARASERGMQRVDDIPLMQATAPVVTAAEGLVLRQIGVDEGRLHADVAGAGFGAPPELFLRFLTPRVMAHPAVRVYVGEVDGAAVTTGVGITIGDAVGVFTIATPEQHRGRRYGSAVTARIVADGLAAGARWSWLQSSPAGRTVYERLGFRTVDTWQCWVTG